MQGASHQLSLAPCPANTSAAQQAGDVAGTGGIRVQTSNQKPGRRALERKAGRSAGETETNQGFVQTLDECLAENVDGKVTERDNQAVATRLRTMERGKRVRAVSNR